MFDEKFVQLLQRGGPDLQGELCLRLLQDLQATRQGLVEAEHKSDWNGVNQYSHVLLALAGTIGANEVYDLARRLNAQSALHIGTDTPIPSLAKLVAETDTLIEHVANYSATNIAKKSWL